MKTKKLFTLAGVCLAALAIAAAYHHGRHAAARRSCRDEQAMAQRLGCARFEAYGKIPLTFEENSGQTDARVKFLARGAGYTVFLTDRDATLRLEGRRLSPGSARPQAVVRLALAGSNSHPVAHRRRPASRATPTISSATIRRNGDAMYRNIARVKFDAVYPGIDLVYYGSQGQLESDYVVSPGADPNRIALRVEGADHVRLNSDGDAILSTAAGDVSLHQPRAYQESVAGRTEVAANYTQLASGDARHSRWRVRRDSFRS